MAERKARGKSRFVLGSGPEGVCGHVELELERVPTPGYAAVSWRVERGDLPDEARSRVEAFLRSYLAFYVRTREFGLEVTVTEVGFDAVRRNDYERAANVALREALERLGLPTPPLFAP